MQFLKINLLLLAGCRTVSNYGSKYFSGLGSLEHHFRGSGLVQVHSSKILLVQVRFGFIDLKFNCHYSFCPEKKKEKWLILLKFTTALIVRVSAPAASRYGKLYSYFCLGFRFGLGSLEHNFEGSGLVQVH